MTDNSTPAEAMLNNTLCMVQRQTPIIEEQNRRLSHIEKELPRKQQLSPIYDFPFHPVTEGEELYARPDHDRPGILLAWDLHHKPKGLLAGDPLDDLLQEGPHQDAGTLGPRLISKTIVPLVTIVQLMLPSLDVSGMDSYDGTTNPNEHMENIEAVLTYREVRGAVKSLRKRGTYRGKEKRENEKW